MSVRRIAVIVASINPGPSLERSLRGFLREVEGQGEVLLVDASTDGSAERARQLFPGLRILSREMALIPELWGEGLRESDAELVAFSTTQMVPREGWLSALVVTIEGSSACGVGGVIDCDDGLGSVDRAIYLQRHSSYGSNASLPKRPSGENSLYRSLKLREVESSWNEGFWETEVQRQLEDQGEKWATATMAVVIYQGFTPLLSITRQRMAHARRFGAIRARSWSHWRRIAQLIATPLVPGLLLIRAAKALMRRGMSILPWLTALPSLVIIAGAWAVGEAIGIASGRTTEQIRHQREGRAWKPKRQRESWSLAPASLAHKEPPQLGSLRGPH